jgi:MbtH protein
MMAWEENDAAIYTVIVNHEEQYSIWPNWKAIPAGWHVAGETGPKLECLAYVNEVWTNMRPLSLRRRMGVISTASNAMIWFSMGNGKGSNDGSAALDLR